MRSDSSTQGSLDLDYLYFSIIIHHLALKERCRPHRLSNMHFTACKWCADGHLGGVYASQVRHSQATRRYSISYTLHTPPRVKYLFHVPHSHVLHRLYHPARTLFRTNLKVALTGKPNQHHQQPTFKPHLTTSSCLTGTDPACTASRPAASAAAACLWLVETKPTERRFSAGK